jgi:hypothetical protein
MNRERENVRHKERKHTIQHITGDFFAKDIREISDNVADGEYTQKGDENKVIVCFLEGDD